MLYTSSETEVTCTSECAGMRLRKVNSFIQHVGWNRLHPGVPVSFPVSKKIF